MVGINARAFGNRCFLSICSLRMGHFFCQLNDDEMAYGKVLLDEVFGRANFLNQVSVKMKQTAGASGGGEDKRLKKKH